MKQFYDTCKTIIIGFILIAIVTTILYFGLITNIGSKLILLCLGLYVCYSMGSIVLVEMKNKKGK